MGYAQDCSLHGTPTSPTPDPGGGNQRRPRARMAPGDRSLHRRSSAGMNVSRPRGTSWWLEARMCFALMAALASSSALAGAQSQGGSDTADDATEDSGTNLQPTADNLGKVADIVDLVICLASVIGALIIIIPYIVSKNSRKLRHSLILGLATSDLVSSLTVIASTSFLLGGGNLVQASRFCTFLGFALSTSVYTQHFWNLCILGVTYMILVHPLANFTLTIERRIIWLWPAIWAAAMIINGFAWGYAGFTYSGGYCYVGPFAGRYFGSLFQFIPRSIVVMAILILYTRLFFFLRRTNLFNSASAQTSSVQRSARSVPQEISPSSAAEGLKEGDDTPSDQVRRKFSLPFLRKASLADSSRNNSVTTRSPVSGIFPRSRKASVSSTIPIEMRQYTFGARGGHVPRCESPPSPGTMPSTQHSDGDTTGQQCSYLTVEQKGAQPRRSRSLSDVRLDFSQAQLSAGSTAREPEAGNNGYDSRSGAGTPRNPAAPPTGPRARRANSSGADNPLRMPLSSVNAPSSTNTPSSISTLTSINNIPLKRPVLPYAGDTSTVEELEDEDEIPDYHTWVGLTPMRSRRDARDFNMITPPREHLRQFSLRSSQPNTSRPRTAPAHQTTFNLRRKDSMNVPLVSASNPGSRRGSANDEVAISMPSADTEVPLQPYESALGESWTWGMEVAVGEDVSPQSRNASLAPDSDLPVEFAATPAPRNGRGKRGSSGAPFGAGGAQTGTTSSSSDEHGVDNLGSTLNRQASALLLLYPLAYLCLFSISLVRIVLDLANLSEARLAGDTLHSVSRWFIFAQGALDCIIFKVIERQFRIRLKRKRARARGEDPGATGSQRAWAWTASRIRAMIARLRRGKATDGRDGHGGAAAGASDEEQSDRSDALKGGFASGPESRRPSLV